MPVTMMPRIQTVRYALQVLIASSAVIVTLHGDPALAQQAPTSAPSPELQEIVVTGSFIKRTDSETPSPVQFITSQDILNTGYTNVVDVLRTLSSNGAGTLNQSFGNAFAAGASGIALRGLSVGDTLTVIDSERMVSYPLSDDGERSFVDVTTVPINAVDSIEVLKDGASALYGADAIAGVVNIKLKKTYVGSEFTLEGGSTQYGDGTTEHGAGIWGMGDLASDGYNFYVALDWHHQDKILGANRSNEAFATSNWSSLPGGLNTEPGAIGASGFTYPNSITGYLINPNTASGRPYAFLPGCDQASQNADKCTFPFPGLVQSPTTQINLLSKFTKSLSNDWAFTVTGSVFDSSAEQVANQGPGFGYPYASTGQEAGSITDIVFGPGRLASTITFPVLSLPANSPLNPFGKPANLVYSFADVGPYVTNIDTLTYRLFGDLHGSAAGWDIDGQVGAMYASMTQKYFGGVYPGLAQQALNSGAYVPGVSTNGQALFAPETSAHPSSTLDVIDLHASHALFDMPGGPLSLATGVQYIHKALNATNPSSITSGQQDGAIAFAIGSQDDIAEFIELGGKILPQLEVTAAGRYDHYDTYGGSFTPKFGLKFSPVEQLTVRGTWGKGFRAPSIAESGTAGQAFGLATSYDPVLCPGGNANVKGTFNSLCAYSPVFVQGANPDLKAVTSTNATFGVIFEPVRQFNASLDWYWIDLKNDIISASEAGGIYTDAIQFVRGPPAALPVCTATTTGGVPCPTAVVQTPVGYPSYTLTPYVNAGETKTSGFDLDVRGQFDVGDLGRVKAEINATYIREYELVFGGQTYDLAGTHGPSGISGDTGNPKIRSVASLTWEKGPVSTTVSANYRSSFHITDPSDGQNTCLSAIQASTPTVVESPISSTLKTLPSQWNTYCSVHHFTSVNLYANYASTDHFSVHGSITNLFNSPAPVDLATYGGAAQFRYTTLDQDGVVGRFFLVGATYKF